MFVSERQGRSYDQRWTGFLSIGEQVGEEVGSNSLWDSWLAWMWAGCLTGVQLRKLGLESFFPIKKLGKEVRIVPMWDCYSEYRR